MHNFEYVFASAPDLHVISFNPKWASWHKTNWNFSDFNEATHKLS